MLEVYKDSWPAHIRERAKTEPQAANNELLAIGLTLMACWHPELGYLRFNSYSTVTPSNEPDPRGCFSRRADAEMRQHTPSTSGRNPTRGTPS